MENPVRNVAAHIGLKSINDLLRYSLEKVVNHFPLMPLSLNPNPIPCPSIPPTMPYQTKCGFEATIVSSCFGIFAHLSLPLSDPCSILLITPALIAIFSLPSAGFPRRTVLINLGMILCIMQRMVEDNQSYDIVSLFMLQPLSYSEREFSLITMMLVILKMFVKDVAPNVFIPGVSTGNARVVMFDEDILDNLKQNLSIEWESNFLV